VFGSISLFGYALPDPEHSTGARVFLVVGYPVAASLWWRAGRKTQLAADSLLWCLGAVLLFLLALNKLFNLRLVSEAGMRALAKSGHWYGHRQPVQFALALLRDERFFEGIVRPCGDGLCFCLTSPFARLRGGSPFSHGSRQLVIVTGVWSSKPLESRLSLSARLHCGIKSEFVWMRANKPGGPNAIPSWNRG